MNLTVGDLCKALEGKHDSLPVVIDSQNSEHDYTLANTAHAAR